MWQHQVYRICLLMFCKVRNSVSQCCNKLVLIQLWTYISTGHSWFKLDRRNFGFWIAWTFNNQNNIRNSWTERFLRAVVVFYLLPFAIIIQTIFPSHVAVPLICTVVCKLNLFNCYVLQWGLRMHTARPNARWMTLAPQPYLTKRPRIVSFLLTHKHHQYLQYLMIRHCLILKRLIVIGQKWQLR